MNAARQSIDGPLVSVCKRDRKPVSNSRDNARRLVWASQAMGLSADDLVAAIGHLKSRATVFRRWSDVILDPPEIRIFTGSRD
jgi:hypothetical protein